MLKKSTGNLTFDRARYICKDLRRSVTLYQTHQNILTEYKLRIHSGLSGHGEIKQRAL